MRRKKAAALRYEIGLRAPKITALGFGDIADRIIHEAEKNGIPVIENEELIEGLSTLELGQDIPPELYEVCAAVISYIYSLDKDKSSLK